MESWPTDDRNVEDLLRKERKGKQKESIPHRYPSLEHGLVEALTLEDNNGHLAWTSLLKDSAPSRKHLRSNESVKVFPATRLPAIHASQTSIAHRAEQGANFLRKHFPDVDVTAQLIRGEIENDAKLLAEQLKFNPLEGNSVECLTRWPVVGSKDVYLAFPTGQTGSDLNIASFVQGNVFRPHASPVKTFQTPITQITAAQNSAHPLFAVRTYGTASILKFNHEGNHLPVQVIERAVISAVDVGGHQIVDLKLPSSPKAYLVNDQGTAYIYHLATATSSIIFNYADLGSTSEVMSDDFWRLAAGRSPTEVILTSGKTLRMLDTRSRAQYVELFSVVGQDEFITSVEGQDDHLTRLSSTTQISWIDDRYPAKPLLGIPHYRHYDRTLTCRTLHTQEGPLTLLTSSKNGLITVYDVSRSHDTARVHANALPYSLTTPTILSRTNAGHAVVQYSDDEDVFGLFIQGDDRSILRIDCSTNDLHDGLSNVRWSDDLKDLDEQAHSAHPDLGPLGRREYIEEDLSAAYSRMHRGTLAKLDARISNTVYNLAENASAFWQDTGAPLEHILTFFDVIFRSGDEPETAYRSDFLTGSAMNSTRGYRSLQQRRLTVQALAKGVAWHRDLTETLHVFDSTISNDIDEVYRHLGEYNILEAGSSPLSFRWENKSREQLSVDLTMAAYIYSAHSFRRPTALPDNLEAMTEALTIRSEPPPVVFQYFRPRPRVTPLQRRTLLDDQDNQTDGFDEVQEIVDEPEDIDCPLGVRLLLNEWDVGSNPEDFVYNDPYDEAEEASVKEKPVKPKPINTTQVASRLHARAPPAIVTVHAPGPHVVRPVFASQPPPVASDVKPSSQSQIGTVESSQRSIAPMTSTQVLPGRHGGRSVPPKTTKSAKKRMGGF